MKRFLFAGFCSLAYVVSAPAATHDEIRAQQTLGRVVTARDGSFFLYEWMRPYHNWTPDPKGLAPAAAARPQTWIYKVGTEYPVTPSYYLFHPHPRATYYLGDLSPDQQRIAFYELDRTENTIRAGVLTFDHPAYPTINWFDAPPVSESLDEPALWVSDSELAYQAQSGFVRGTLPAFKKRKLDEPSVRDDLVKTSSCSDCPARARAKKKAERGTMEGSKGDGAITVADTPGGTAPGETPKVAEGSNATEIPKGAKLLARSADGELSVYAVDTPDVLTLLYRKGDGVQTLFENDRKPNKLARE